MTELAEGQSIPLLYTAKSRERVVAGLSWDPRGKTSMMDRLKGDNQQYDLDITCFVFDEYKEYIDFVGAEAQDSMDQSGAIYHSGDDMTGEGDEEDEFITVELAGLPDDAHHIVFLVEIRSNHVFGEIPNPFVRIVDSMTHEELFKANIAEEDGKDSAAYIFARIYRDRTSKTGWSLHYIGDYPDISQIEDWGKYLTRYLA
ncbi:MAG: TerD family protein [Rhodospirillales bacterium]|nr:TerD family protein [Alphaproteobacteria bacterium]USO03255.1 MAG: TerD family protein [Rhodospirillales bacterium]